jgi:hypothetical protein
VPEAKPSKLPLILILSGVGILAGVAVALIVSRKRKPVEDAPVDLSDETFFEALDDNATQFLITGHPGSGSGGSLTLILNDVEQPHKRFEAHVASKIEIGRSPEAPGITIDYDRRISRRHCAVIRRDGGLWIEDMGAANKPQVNGETLYTPRMLKDGDVIALGSTKLSVKIERR